MTIPQVKKLDFNNSLISTAFLKDKHTDEEAYKKSHNEYDYFKYSHINLGVWVRLPRKEKKRLKNIRYPKFIIDLSIGYNVINFLNGVISKTNE